MTDLEKIFNEILPQLKESKKYKKLKYVNIHLNLVK